MVSVFQDCFRRIFSYGGQGPDGPDPGGPTDPDGCIDANDTECCEANPLDPNCDDGGGGTDSCTDPVTLVSCGEDCDSTNCCGGNKTTLNVDRSFVRQYCTDSGGNPLPCTGELPPCVKCGTNNVVFNTGGFCTTVCCPSDICAYWKCTASQDGCLEVDDDGCCVFPSPDPADTVYLPQGEPCPPAVQVNPVNLYDTVEQCKADGCINEGQCLYYICDSTTANSNGNDCVSQNKSLIDLGVETCEDAPDTIEINEKTAYKDAGACKSSEAFCCPAPTYYECTTDSNSSCGTCVGTTVVDGTCDIGPIVDSDPDKFATESECDDACPEKEDVWVCPNAQSEACISVPDYCTADDLAGEGVTWFRDVFECEANANNGIGCCVPPTYWYCPVGHSDSNTRCVSYTANTCDVLSQGPGGQQLFNSQQACEKSSRTYCCDPNSVSFSNQNCEYNDGDCVVTGECPNPDNLGVIFANSFECNSSVATCQDCYDNEVWSGFQSIMEGRLTANYDTPNNYQAVYFCDGDPSPRTLEVLTRDALGPTATDYDSNGNPVYDTLSDFGILLDGSILNTNTVVVGGQDYVQWTVDIDLTQPTTIKTYTFIDQCGQTIASIPVTYRTFNCFDSLDNFIECQNLNNAPLHPFDYTCVLDPCLGPFANSFPECVDPGNPVDATAINGNFSNQGGFGEIQQRQGINYLKELNSIYEEDKIIDIVGSNKKTTFSRSEFTPMRNYQYLNIFSNTIHASIWAVLNLGQESFATEKAFDDIKLDYIYRSLNTELRDKIDKLVDFDGLPLKRKILTRISRKLIAGELDDFDTQFDDLQSEHDLFRRSRSVTTENSLVELINTKAKPLNHKVYGGYTKERMRLWKTLATDLQKAIPFVDKDSNLNFIDIKLDDSYTLLDYNGDPTIKYINEGDFITYINKQGNRDYLDLDTLIEKAVALDFEDLRRAFALLNEDYGTVLKAVSEEESLIEETYSLEEPRQDFYFMKLNVSTIEDLPTTNPLIRKTSAVFEYLYDEDEINEWIEFKPWPYLHFHIESSDPLLDHMMDSGKVIAEFKDISFNKLQGYADGVPVIPRRMPWYIVIIPTDKTRYLVGSGRSKLTAYNERKATFRLSPSKKDIQQKWNSEIYNEEQTDFFEGIDPRVEQQSLKVTFDRYKLKNTKNQYQKGSEKLPRKPSASRRLFEAIREAKEEGKNFIDVANSVIEWGSVFKNLTANERKEIYNDMESFNDKKDLIATNTFAKTEAVRERFVKISEVIDNKLTNINDYEPPPVTTRVRAVKIDEEFKTETPEILE